MSECATCKTSPRVSYDSYCRPCINKQHRGSTPYHTGRKLYWQRLRKQKNEKLLARDQRNAKLKELREPEKLKARRALQQKVRSGKIIKPLACSNCLLVYPRIEGHHYLGYKRPLSVIWLCVGCHRKEHEKARGR